MKPVNRIYTPHGRWFEQQRNRLTSIAYRMLGSLSDAEDVLQDAYLRWQQVKLNQVESPEAFLTSMVSRLSIDRLRRERTRRLTYTGPWLPEPISESISDALGDPEKQHEQAESISMAFLLLLEHLSPTERGVFILKEAFDLDHRQIAETLTITPANSRQLLRRAREKMGKQPLEPQDATQHEALVAEFLQAAASGSLDSLQALMTEDIIAYSDGGGRVSAALIPLVGPERVATVLSHLIKNMPAGTSTEMRQMNGQPAMVIFDGPAIHSSHTMVTKGGLIHRIYTVRNPGKLHYL